VAGDLDIPADTLPEVSGSLPPHSRLPGFRLGELVGVVAENGSAVIDKAKARFFPPAPEEGDEGVASVEEHVSDRKFIFRPAALGFFALVLVALGASLPSSPFKLEAPGSWYFGVPTQNGPPSQTFLLLGLVAVYGGLVLLMRVWLGLNKALVTRPGMPMKYLWFVMLLWMVPMLIVAPLFSRDVFSYAAQGEMVSRHINPYNYGPGVLGAGPYVNYVDPLWANTPAPYGPLFLMFDGFFATASLHNELVTVIFLRLFALAGVALIAWCIPRLARAYGVATGSLFSLTVLNPLVVLTLVAAGHNDAVMIGLLLAGFTAAKCKHPVWGVVLCTLAAAIKAPAALGIIYVGWEWMGPGINWRQRVRPLVTAGVLASAIMALLSLISGLGWGWIKNLETPGTVRSWMAPATGLGELLSWLMHTVGIGVSLAGVLSFTRVTGLLLAGAAALYLLKHSERIGGLKALGTSMLLFAILGPVLQPWYLTWGIILLAPVAVGRLRSAIITLSVVSPFIGLPGGRTLLSELIHADPLAVAVALLALLLVLVAPIGRWSRMWSWPPDGEHLGAWGEDLALTPIQG